MRFRFYSILIGAIFSASAYGQLSQELKAESAKLASCYASMKEDARLNILKTKIGDVSSNYADQPSIELLGERSKSNSAERTAIATWGKLRQDCDKSAQAFFLGRTELRGIGQIFSEQSKKFYELLSALYAGDLNYGEFNRQRYELNLESKKKFNDLAAADAANRQSQAELSRKNSVLAEREKAERQAVLKDLLNKQAVNTKERERSERCGLLDADCVARQLLNSNWTKAVEDANKINAYIENQQIKWVKGEITGIEFASTIYDYHKRIQDMDSYDREEYMFYMKIARASDSKDISIADAVYLMEKNSNQIIERRRANEPPRSISFTCSSQDLGGFVTTKCR